MFCPTRHLISGVIGILALNEDPPEGILDSCCISLRLHRILHFSQSSHHIHRVGLASHLLDLGVLYSSDQYWRWKIRPVNTYMDAHENIVKLELCISLSANLTITD